MRVPSTPFRALLLGAVLSLVLPAAALAQVDIDPNGVLNLATNADPTLNPWSANAVIESNLINSILFDQLVRYDTGNLAPSPGLAQSWEIADDGMSWTFQLRQDVVWSDGEPFDAEDVAFTFNDVVLNRELGANRGSTFTPVSQVVIVDPHTVRFELNTPFSSLAYYLAYYAGILPEHVLGSAENPLTVAEFNKVSPVVTGPYRVDEFVPGAYVSLVPNENYWGETPKLAGIVFSVLPDNNAQVAQLLAGSLDMVTVNNPALLAGMARNPDLKVLRQSQNIWYFVTLNLAQERFQDVRVRQALLTAIDREAMIEAILEGYGVQSTGPIAPLQGAFYDYTVASHDYDPERALALFAEAGWTRGADGFLQKDGERLSINMETGQFGYLVNATLLVQQYWQDIGIEVVVETIEWNAYIQQIIVQRNFNATLAWWSTPPTPDIAPYFSSATADVGNNMPGYRNPELDALMDAARAATSAEEQVAIVKEIQALVADELPYLFLWYPDILTVYDTKLVGLAEINNAAAFQHSFDWYIRR